MKDDIFEERSEKVFWIFFLFVCFVSSSIYLKIWFFPNHTSLQCCYILIITLKVVVIYYLHEFIRKFSLSLSRDV